MSDSPDEDEGDENNENNSTKNNDVDMTPEESSPDDSNTNDEANGKVVGKIEQDVKQIGARIIYIMGFIELIYII